MKLGISIELYKPEDLRRKVSAAAASGFKYCQMFLREVEVSEKIAEEVAEVCSGRGVSIGPVGAYLNPLLPDESPMGYNIEKLRRTVEILPVLGSKEIVVWSGTLSHELLEYRDGNYSPGTMGRLTKITGQILKLLDPIGGVLVFEPYYTHVLHDEKSIISFIDQVGSDRVKVVLDPPNLITPDEYERRDERIGELFDTLKGHIGAVHFKDFRLRPDRVWDYPGPGGGVMNYPLLMRKILGIGYSSWGIIEHVGPDEYGSAREFVEKSVEAAGSGNV